MLCHRLVPLAVHAPLSLMPRLTPSFAFHELTLAKMAIGMFLLAQSLDFKPTLDLLGIGAAYSKLLPPRFHRLI